MSVTFSIDKWHILQLSEAQRVNELLDARLAKAGVPAGSDVEIAGDILLSALIARFGVYGARQLIRGGQE